VADGNKRLVQMNVVDNSVIARVTRSTSHLRRR
jgi:hypothetical protein